MNSIEMEGMCMSERYSIGIYESEKLNNIKAISLMLVIYIHMSSDINSSKLVTYIIYIIAQIIARSAVPTFFLISAVLLYRKDFTFKNNIKKKLQTLMIPYFFWNTIWLLIFLICQKIPAFSSLFNNPQNNISNFKFWDWVEVYIPLIVRSKPFVYPLWFLKDLFFLNIFAILLKRIVDRFPKLTVFVFGCVYLFKLNLIIFEAQSLFYFTLGYIIVRYNIRCFDFRSFKKNGFIYLFIYLFIVILLGLFELTTGITLFAIHEIIIFYGVCILIKYVPSWKQVNNSIETVIKKIESKMFFIFCFHEWTLLFLRKIANIVFPKNSILDMMIFVFLPIILVIIAYIVAVVFNAIMPRLYSNVTGGR